MTSCFPEVHKHQTRFCHFWFCLVVNVLQFAALFLWSFYFCDPETGSFKEYFLKVLLAFTTSGIPCLRFEQSQKSFQSGSAQLHLDELKGWECQYCRVTRVGTHSPYLICLPMPPPDGGLGVPSREHRVPAEIRQQHQLQ